MVEKIRDILLGMIDLKTVIAFLVGLAISVLSGLAGVDEKAVKDELCGGKVNEASSVKSR